MRRLKEMEEAARTLNVHEWNYFSPNVTVFIKLKDLDQPDTFAAFPTSLKSCLDEFTLSLGLRHDQTAE